MVWEEPWEVKESNLMRQCYIVANSDKKHANMSFRLWKYMKHVYVIHAFYNSVGRK